MGEALNLASRVRGRTSPNPNVGAVIVRDGQVVGRGATAPAGGPHAEVFALREAGERARDATMYVTLEPCSHVGRTPPCAPAVADAGIRRVFAAMQDPDPRVNGEGIRFLHARGIETHVGLLEDRARQSLEAFIKRTSTGLPFVELKVAMTLDGKIATSSGKSRWITGAAAREWVHQRRDAADAVLIGANTLRLDDPELTVRLPHHDDHQPLRVVVSATGKLDPAARAFHGPPPGALVFCRDTGLVWRNGGKVAVGPLPSTLSGGEGMRAVAVAEAGVAAGVDVVALPALDGPGVDLTEMLRELARRGINDVLAEGGAQLNAGLLRAGLVDCLSIFVAPKLFGGSSALGGFGELGVDEPDGAFRLSDIRVSQVGDDWLFQGKPIRGDSAA